MPCTVSVENLLTWNETTTQRWRAFFRTHPMQLLLPCDIRNGKNVADTLQHIFVVELRYAQRLAGLPESPYEEIPKHSIDTLLCAHTLAFDLIRNLLADPNYDWSQEITFDTITLGRLRASRETILVHLILHGIRHYAQLATLIRHEGFKTDWPMDYLFVGARRV
jgi:uncharacterized damage-inducible protein DinB